MQIAFICGKKDSTGVSAANGKELAPIVYGRAERGFYIKGGGLEIRVPETVQGSQPLLFDSFGSARRIRGERKLGGVSQDKMGGGVHVDCVISTERIETSAITTQRKGC